MEAGFYSAAVVAIIATVFAITRSNAVHALLYLIVSLLAVAIVFFTIGARFVAALEVIIYAGAIMVLFVFVVMLLNLSARAAAMERRSLKGKAWVGPSLLSLCLLAETSYLLLRRSTPPLAFEVTPKQVGIALFGPYVIAVELASILLLSGLVGSYHVGWREEDKKELENDIHSDESRIPARHDLIHTGARRSDRPP
jgi:NADH-quinone oxidoreductase subunit J